ncbi:MAG: metallophosphoesterase family protein [Spirochaetota bacterium]
MIRILQTSDVHLGHSSYLPIDDSHRLITLDKILTSARNHDLLLVCGGLFSGITVHPDTVSRVLKQLADLSRAGTRVVITPTQKESQLYQNLDHPNIIVCTDDIRTILFDSLDPCLTVYAGSLSQPDDLFSITRSGSSGYHLGVFHTDFLVYAADENDTAKNGLSGLTLDFYALGGFHNFRVFRSGGVPFAAYSGTPETVYPGENRERYVLSYEIGKTSIERMKRLAVNTLMYDRLFIDCRQYGSSEEIYNMVKKLAGPNTILEVNLKGDDLFTEHTDIRSLASMFKLLLVHNNYNMQLVDLAGRYLREDSLRGDFYRALSAQTGGSDTSSLYDTKFLAGVLDAIDSQETLTEEYLCKLFSV